MLYLYTLVALYTGYPPPSLQFCTSSRQFSLRHSSQSNCIKFYTRVIYFSIFVTPVIQDASRFSFIIIYKYKVPISVCLSVCLSDHNSLDTWTDLPQVLIGELKASTCVFVFTLPPRDSTLQYKRWVHLWNNFLCIITLDRCSNFNSKILFVQFFRRFNLRI